MRLSVITSAPETAKTDLLIIPMFKSAGKNAARQPPKFSGAAAAIDKALGGELSALREAERMTGKEGEHSAMRTLHTIPATQVLLLGAGAGPLRPATARRVAALASKLARTHRAKQAVFVLADDAVKGGAKAVQALGHALAEGAVLGEYRFLKYRDDDHRKHAENAVESFAFATGKRAAQALDKGIAHGLTYAHATVMARDLVAEPASQVTPGHLADVARSIAAANPKRIAVKILDRAGMEALKMGGVLSIAKGSDEPPYLIHLVYKPVRKAKRRVAIVGKGITFDSGGLSIKPAKHMEDMKIDMAGCAAMLGAFSALAALAPEVEIHGISAVCENMPSGKAVRPGDVVRTMSGKTIEILNTDAEGRVTLADTLWYGAQLKPDAMIDLATLTGACMVALGQEVAGIMSNDHRLAQRIGAAAQEEGELLWELPLVDEYRESVQSRMADLRNTSTSGYGGAITAGVFLEEFTDGAPWAHLDIAGPAWAERDSVPHQPVGATGFGVRTLLRYVEDLR